MTDADKHRIKAAIGYYELGMDEDAWDELIQMETPLLNCKNHSWPRSTQPDFFLNLAKQACINNEPKIAEHLCDLAVLAAGHDNNQLKALKLKALDDPTLAKLLR